MRFLMKVAPVLPQQPVQDKKDKDGRKTAAA